LLAIFITAVLLIGVQSQAQFGFGSVWFPDGPGADAGYVTLVDSTWGLLVPGLATSTTGCLAVTALGWISANGSDCGGAGALVFGDLTDVATSSDATGDIWYLSSAGQIVNLGVGSNDEVLTLASGIPSWAAASAKSALKRARRLSIGLARAKFV
ncbi:hypothetical protein IIC65_08450, partial [Candidatus Sumerlaeota bacterium]|nr:hypothetical protein [Candidatus Sumerlaeota bacterium]